MKATGAGLAALAFQRDATAAEQARPSLRCGVSKVKITPPVGAWLVGWEIRTRASEAVSDDLYARAMVFSSGSDEVAMISTDLIGMPADITRRIRRAVKEKTGWPPERILICASHTHFGPAVRGPRKAARPDLVDQKGVDPKYIDSLVGNVVSAVLEARLNLQPVRIGAGRGSAPHLLYNRRTRRPDGKVVMTFVLPPAEEGLVFGPIDPSVGVLRVEDSRGQLIGSMINFACHPVVGGGHGTGWEGWFYHISADYPAYAVQVVEMTEGGVCLFTLGAAGDMVPVRRGVRPRFEIGWSLGAEALRAMQFMETSADASIAAVRREITLPRIKQADPSAELEDGLNEVTAEIHGIRIGNIIFVGLPGEVLVELGLDLKRRAGVENLFLLSLANDSIGYICHEAAYDEGGYETERGTVLERGGGEKIVDTALEVITALKTSS